MYSVHGCRAAERKERSADDVGLDLWYSLWGGFFRGVREETTMSLLVTDPTGCGMDYYYLFSY